MCQHHATVTGWRGRRTGINRGCKPTGGTARVKGARFFVNVVYGSVYMLRYTVCAGKW